MKLGDFLSLLVDEETRICLEIDSDELEEYEYIVFWHSDYRAGVSDAYKYKDCKITGFSFYNEEDEDILIQIKKI